MLWRFVVVFCYGVFKSKCCYFDLLALLIVLLVLILDMYGIRIGYLFLCVLGKVNCVLCCCGVLLFCLVMGLLFERVIYVGNFDRIEWEEAVVIVG